jgi:hypothetical protein
MAKKGYCDKTDIVNYNLTEIDASFDTQIDEWIEVAEGIIDKETERSFIADSVASARWFDGSGQEEMVVDENVDITEVLVYDSNGDLQYTMVEGVDFEIYPYNNFPIRKMILKYTSSMLFLKGMRNVKITAKWGYSVAVPAQIKFAATVLASLIMNFSNESDGEIKSETIGDYSVSYREDKQQDVEKVKDIIGNFTKHDVV